MFTMTLYEPCARAIWVVNHEASYEYTIKDPAEDYPITITTQIDGVDADCGAFVFSNV